MNNDDERRPMGQSLADGRTETPATDRQRAYPNLLPPWKAGQPSPNPGGKPVATRNRLSGRFLRALADDFAEHGAEAIEAARTKDPIGYLRVIASLMPKDVTLNAGSLQELTDDDLLDAIRTAQGYIDAGAPPLLLPTD